MAAARVGVALCLCFAGVGWAVAKPALPKRPGCDQILPGVCGPQIIVGGAMKCGTNTIGDLLLRHRRTKVSICAKGYPAEKRHGKHWELLQHALKTYDGPHKLTFLNESGGFLDAKTCNPHFYQGAAQVKVAKGGKGAPASGHIEAHPWESHHFTIESVRRVPYVDTEFEPLRYDDATLVQEWADRIAPTDGKQTVTFEKAPSYLDLDDYPGVVENIKSMLPHAKAVFAVCDPTPRLYSEYAHRVKVHARWDAQHFNLSSYPNGIPTFVDWANELLREAAKTPEQRARRARPQGKLWWQRTDFLDPLLRGNYAEHLARWVDVFGEDKVLVVHMKDDQNSTIGALLDHFGLPVSGFDFPQEEVHGFANTQGDASAEQYKGRDLGWVHHPREFAAVAEYYRKRNAWSKERFVAKHPGEENLWQRWQKFDSGEWGHKPALHA